MKGKPQYGKCRHCPHEGRLRNRGLCWRCCIDPNIRSQYPSRDDRRHDGDGDFYGGYELPPTLLMSPPGSDARIEELARRVRERVSLFRRDDRRYDEVA